MVLESLLRGLGITAGMALLGWFCSLLIGIVAGLASSRLLWRTLIGHAWPAETLRRLLAIPRSIHELIWGLLLLQVVGLQPAIAVIAIAIPYGALVARVVSDLLDTLPDANLQALRAAGSPAPAALLTAMGPPLLPGLISYGGIGWNAPCAAPPCWACLGWAAWAMSCCSPSNRWSSANCGAGCGCCWR